ncbi:MAG TPA: hypothetical protein VG738_10375 [Chitinophagaceae bacterium]|nr:hypothetical protein [Chitinophagaceae bacterium]
MNAFARLKFFLCLLTIIMLYAGKLDAETLLDRTISLEVKSETLQKTLELISRQGEFYFSYNSNIVNSDSIVSVTAVDTKVKQVLLKLFNNSYEFSETGNYIIIKKVAAHSVTFSHTTVAKNDNYTITGFVIDDRTGRRLVNTSVYDKQRLVSTITNDSGYFSLRLNNKYPSAAITVSKQFYEDTTIIVQPGYNQQINIALIPVDTLPEITTVSPVPVNAGFTGSLGPAANIDSSRFIYTTRRIDSSLQQKTRLGEFFVSAAQRIQSLNIGKFIAEKPYQVSIIPGISTHGKLSGQVVNDVSFNLLGGYNAGVRIAELGILFNINRYNVQHAQLAGVFNITGGSVTGVQAAGIHNLVGKNVTGVQFAGINNLVKGSVQGVQASGIYNHSGGFVNGVQAAGICNYTRSGTKGVQAAGIANISDKELNGIQAAGVFNYTKKLHGLQVGLINIAGNSDGYSIGLINIVVRGYHKINISTNEVMPFNVAVKTGNNNLYSILIGGMDARPDKKLYSFGYGLGTEVGLGHFLTVNPEISCQYIYRGSWKYTNLLNKFSPQFNITLVRKVLTLTGGPVFNVYYSNQTNDVAGYKSAIAPAGYHLYDFHNSRLTGWIGWNVGVTVF